MACIRRAMEIGVQEEAIDRDITVLSSVPQISKAIDEDRVILTF